MNDVDQKGLAQAGAIAVPKIQWTGEDGGYDDVDLYGVANMGLRVEIHVAWARMRLPGREWEDDGWACCATASLGGIAADARAEDVIGTQPSVSRRLAAEAVAGLVAKVRERLGVK